MRKKNKTKQNQGDDFNSGISFKKSERSTEDVRYYNGNIRKEKLFTVPQLTPARQDTTRRGDTIYTRIIVVRRY